MHAEDFVVNECGDGEAVETISEDLPQLNSVSSLTFIIEPVNSVDGGALVITSQQKEVLRVFDLVSQEEAHSLKGHLSTVDVVTEEEVV